MNEHLAQIMKEKYGLELKVRDNEKLIEDTVDHLYERYARIASIKNEVRDQIDTRTKEEIELAKAESVHKFYSGSKRTD
jgi:hypothetical protein